MKFIVLFRVFFLSLVSRSFKRQEDVMQAVVDSKHGVYFRCLLENGDIINVNEADVGRGIDVGDILTVTIARDEKASDRQKELMK